MKAFNFILFCLIVIFFKVPALFADQGEKPKEGFGEILNLADVYYSKGSWNMALGIL